MRKQKTRANASCETADYREARGECARAHLRADAVDAIEEAGEGERVGALAVALRERGVDVL